MKVRVKQIVAYNGHSIKANGSVDLANYFMEREEKMEFELVGVCTDICVISNAMLLKAYYPESTIRVDAKGCAGVTVESHKNALNAMKMCQIELLNNIVIKEFTERLVEKSASFFLSYNIVHL